MKEKCALIILDGWGLGEIRDRDAIQLAQTPYMDSLKEKNGQSLLTTFGTEVGLPVGQMGNSEVGHLNIGAGRVVYQELARINKEIKEGSFHRNPVLLGLMDKAKKKGVRLHFMGLVSDGGVHSHINHLKALCDVADEQDIKEVFIHAFLDGRDTDPHSGLGFVNEIQNHIKDKRAKLASIVGRYYAMDRDRRWERTKVAYDLLVNMMADKCTDDPLTALQECYDDGITDEFMKPILIDTGTPDRTERIREGDVVIFFNFRTDRPRQITEVLVQRNMPDFQMHKRHLEYGTMTSYDDDFVGLHILYTKDNLDQTLGQIVAENKGSQVRIAETEKYPHVTFFLNGGREEAYPGETRIMIPSPKVATYDLKPEMSAVEVTDALIAHVVVNPSNLIILNYANTDMVGHTGVMRAAIKAAETVDQCLSRLIPFLNLHDYHICIIADHGNSDVMINEDGSPNTQHSTNPVPFIFIPKADSQFRSGERNGKLADLAPTILSLLNLPIPEIMSGKPLVVRK